MPWGVVTFLIDCGRARARHRRGNEEPPSAPLLALCERRTSNESAHLARQERYPRRKRAGPKIEHGRDAIIKVTACAICGSDLHLFDGIMPSMQAGDVLGHEPASGSRRESARLVPLLFRLPVFVILRSCSREGGDLSLRATNEERHRGSVYQRREPEEVSQGSGRRRYRSAPGDSVRLDHSSRRSRAGHPHGLQVFDGRSSRRQSINPSLWY